MISNDRLHQLLACDPETGRLTWLIQRPGRATAPGKVAGFMLNDGLFRVSLDGELHFSHHLVWQFTRGVPPASQIGHRDGRRAFNNPANLFETGFALLNPTQMVPRAKVQALR